MSKTKPINAFELSICIATLNRAEYLKNTLAMILGSRSSDKVEVVVVDGASTDNTREVVEEFARAHANLRYHREPENSGVDGDFDKAVEYASGNYCWLMADDDVLSPDAIDMVLDKLSPRPALLVVNSCIFSADMQRVLSDNSVGIEEDRTFLPEQWDEFCAALGGYMSFIGCVVIQREIWLARERQPFYGSLFVHCGVIFQDRLPGKVCFVAAPLMQIRYGNAQWTPRAFEIWMFMWPTLIWSFDAVADSAKAKIVARQPWRKKRSVLLYRATGAYDLATFQKHFSGRFEPLARAELYCVALIPKRFLNTLLALYIVSFRRSAASGLYQLAQSAHSSFVTRQCYRYFDR